MATDEKFPLLNGGPGVTGDEPRAKEVSFLRCALLGSLSTFCVMIVLTSSSPIISQYVHAGLLHKYHANGTEDGGSACKVKNGTAANDGPLVRAQKETSDFLLLLAITNNAPAIFVNVLLGSLSDYIGRKVVFILPTIGIFAKSLFCSLIIYFQMDKEYFFLAHALDGLGGSGCAYLAGVFSLTADITSSDRGRIVATTVVEVDLAVSACTGSLMTGFLIPAIGYQNLSAMMASLALTACILVVFLPETGGRGNKSKNHWSPLAHFKNVFGFYNIFRHNEDKKTARLYLLSLAIFLFSVLTVLGRSSIETLYGLDQPFCWTSIVIGYFGALRIGLANLGSLAAIRVLFGHMRHETLALLGALDSVAACILEGLATTSWMLFLVPVVGIVSSTTVPIIRGTMSRMTSPHEQGAMFAGVGFGETVVNLVCQVLYTFVYSATVAFARGAVFFLMASFSGVAAILCVLWMVVSPKYGYVYTQHIRQEEEVVAAKEDLGLSTSVHLN